MTTGAPEADQPTLVLASTCPCAFHDAAGPGAAGYLGARGAWCGPGAAGYLGARAGPGAAGYLGARGAWCCWLLGCPRGLGAARGLVLLAT